MEMNLTDETIVWAESQFDGRGQRGSGWVSKAGESLTFSMLKRFTNIETDQQFYINLAVSIAVADALRDLKVPHVSVKWPNDIMSDSKKLCGILIENQLVAEKIATSVIGIGINVNNESFPELPGAGSIYQTTGIKFVLEDVFNVVLVNLQKQLHLLILGNFAKLKEEYEDRLFKKDMVSVFEDSNGVKYNGIIRGVAHSGRLIVETDSGILKKYSLKEIKMCF